MAADISTPITQASAAVATTPGKKTGSYNAMDEALTQQDFLELLVTQIKNQDPTKPMDTNVMVSQMAQLSAVQGIADLNKTVATMKEAMRANQALAASMLVGRSVMASTDKANLGDTLEGAVDVPEGAKDVQVNILDDSGNVVKTLSLGSPGVGKARFSWDGVKDGGDKAPQGQYTLEASAAMGSKRVPLSTLAGTRVSSVSLGDGDQETMLNLEGLGGMPLSEAQEIM